MKTNIVRYRTCVCNISCHVVWCVKYRRKVITPQKEQFLKDPVQEIALDKGFTVPLFEAGEMDHIHCFVSAPPKMAITDIVKYLKGITGRKLFEAYPDLRQSCGRDSCGTTLTMWRQSVPCLKTPSGSISGTNPNLTEVQSCVNVRT